MVQLWLKLCWRAWHPNAPCPTIPKGHHTTRLCQNNSRLLSASAQAQKAGSSPHTHNTLTTRAHQGLRTSSKWLAIASTSDYKHCPAAVFLVVFFKVAVSDGQAIFTEITHTRNHDKPSCRQQLSSKISMKKYFFCPRAAFLRNCCFQILIIYKTHT